MNRSALLLFLPLLTSCQPIGPGGMRGMGGWGGYMYGGYILWIIIILVIVAVFFWLYRNNSFKGGSSQGETAREILDRRYARGEISKEEYEEMKQNLSR